MLQCEDPCATPCFPDFPDCQISYCDTENGVCVSEPKVPLPAGCCVRATDCYNNDVCLLGSCNFDTNTCEWDPLCMNSEISDFFHDKTCVDAGDCDSGDSCRAIKCIEGLCVSSPIPDSNDPYCCQVSTDCPESPCRVAVCFVDTFTCGYEPLLGCSLSYEPSDNSYPNLPYFLPPPVGPPPSTLVFNGDGPKPDHIRAIDAVGTAIGGGIIVLLIMILISTFMRFLWDERKKHLEKNQKVEEE